jgi:hypothetical protein
MVLAGLYAREDDVIRDALVRLKQTIPRGARVSRRRPGLSKAPSPRTVPLSPDELNQRLLAAGLVSQLPDPTQDIDDDDDAPLVIKGEPLSETIIRERR